MSLFFKYELIKEPFVENSYGMRRKWRGFPLYEWRQGNNWFTNPQFYELTELEALRWYITVTGAYKKNNLIVFSSERQLRKALKSIKMQSSDTESDTTNSNGETK